MAKARQIPTLKAAPERSQERTAAIRLQFVLASAISSRLIAWWGQSYGGWSHVDAVLPDGSLLGARNDTCGHISAGVEIRPQGYEHWLRRSVVTIQCSRYAADRWETWLRQQIGAPYDQQAIWGFILGKPSHGKGRWICSALQRGALTAVHFLHRCDIPDSETTPNELYQLVTAGCGGTAEHFA